MARIKAKCLNCGKVIWLLLDDEEFRQMADIKKGEGFEHKCPACEEWALFEFLE